MYVSIPYVCVYMYSFDEPLNTYNIPIYILRTRVHQLFQIKRTTGERANKHGIAWNCALWPHIMCSWRRIWKEWEGISLMSGYLFKKQGWGRTSCRSNCHKGKYIIIITWTFPTIKQKQKEQRCLNVHRIPGPVSKELQKSHLQGWLWE